MWLKTRLDPNLSSDEEIVREQREHALLSLYLPLLGCLTMTALTIVIAVIIFSYLPSESGRTQALVIGILVTTGILFALLTWFKWTTTWHILTDNQLILSWFSFRKLGPEGTAISLSKIHEAKSSHNLWESVLDTGDLQVLTAANTSPTVFSNVTNLKDFRSEINERLHETQLKPDHHQTQFLTESMDKLIKTLEKHTEALKENTAALKATKKSTTEGEKFQL